MKYATPMPTTTLPITLKSYSSVTLINSKNARTPTIIGNPTINKYKKPAIKSIESENPVHTLDIKLNAVMLVKIK